MKTYFVTGATGAIGSALIPILLQDSDTRINLLLRAKSVEDLGARLEELFLFWQIAPNDLGTRSDLSVHWSISCPDVLADRHRAHRFTEMENSVLARIGPRREVSLFIKHGIVRQQSLAIDRLDATIHAQRSCVIDMVTVRVDKPDDCSAVTGLFCEATHSLHVVFDESTLQHEIFRRIADQHQLREHHDVAAFAFGTGINILCKSSVTGDVTHGRVHLGQRNTHTTRLTNRHKG